MHELALAQEVVDTLRQSAAQNRVNHIRSVRLVVGRLAAGPEELAFALRRLTPEPLLVGTSWDIVAVDAVAYCSRCSREINQAPLLPACPHCGSLDVLVQAGREFYIQDYEAD